MREHTSSRIAQSAIVASARIAVASSPSFATRGTVFTTVLALPALQLTLFVAIAFAVKSEHLAYTAYAGILVNAGSAVMSAMIRAVTQDRQLGLLQEVVNGSRFSVAYWVGKALVPCALNVAVSLLLVGAVSVFAGSTGFSLLGASAALVVVAVAVGALTGVAVATLSLGLRDPYALSNALSLAVPLTAGVMAPLSVYPVWGQVIAQTFPLTATVSALRAVSAGDPAGTVLAHLGVELLVTGAWVAVGVGSGRWVLRGIRNGTRDDDIW